MGHFREETINVQLANVLTARGLAAHPETILSKGRPDVLIDLDGIKLIIEGRKASHRQSLLKDTRERIEQGIADISMAILYPEDLFRIVSMGELTKQIEILRYDGALFHFSQGGIVENPFYSASLNDLVETINNAFHLLVQNDVVRAYVTRMENTIEKVVNTASETNLFFQSEALTQRLKEALGIGSGASKEEIPD